ncbi:mitogen-activated protein kinase [Jimgerdemannia flammicorona]|uniref:Mitogen-activated protein kinase n=2 Tax=Jimgerdemannia flammicorona TaxID=994334 RepID=A0A433DJJ2_9FUNG|nr:mitogen-activated protein kinase [Jimgerdemannia flammicorona]RUS32953.1 mitogen-activated protein kinase [Jimgerdemannia flammicorona]
MSSMSVQDAVETLSFPYYDQGLKAVAISDRDGVTLVKCLSSTASPSILEQVLPTTFAVANAQASKLGLKKNKSIVSIFGLHQVVQLDQSPLIITMVANAHANTGALLDLGNALKEITQVIVNAMQKQQAGNGGVV